MTPEEYVERITALVRQSRDAEALAVAEAYGRAVLPRLSFAQLSAVSDMLEGAELAAAAAPPATAAVSSQPRRSRASQRK